ncbi:zinc finger protein 638-like isoform X2 [Saccostrea cucullata]|uniref:zinc finger protein 638-like isoform X2 n=1 Tax=Saccostrea cuccullata TaxID=36930 RepID=UPI002ED36EEE
MNPLRGNFGQGLLGNSPASSNFSIHDQNRFLGGDGSFFGNQESYIGDGGGYARDQGGYARDLGDSGGRMGDGNSGAYFGDTDLRGTSFREQVNGSGRYGDQGMDLNRGNRSLSGDHDYRNEEDIYSVRNSMQGGRQDRLSGGGSFGDDRGRGQDQFNRLGMGGLGQGARTKTQGILGSGPIVGGDTDLRIQGGFGGMGNQARGGNVQGVGNLGFSPPSMGGQGMQQQSGGLGLPLAGMETNLLNLQIQQKQQEAVLRDTQLQMVNNLLLQHQNKRGNQMNPGFGGPSLLGTPQNLQSGLMGSPGGKPRNTGHIPSLLDINTKKPQGKRGFSGPRDQGGFKKQRMTPPQKRTPDRRNDNSSNRGPRRRSQERPRSSEGTDSRSTPRRKESDGAPGILGKCPAAPGVKPLNTSMTKIHGTPEVKQLSTHIATPQETAELNPQVSPVVKPKQTGLAEKYDPEEPTEDEVMDFEEDKDVITVLDLTEEEQPLPAGSEDIEDVTIVTVEKNQEEHEDKPKEKSSSNKKLTNFYCHVCSTECRDAEGFAKHMNGIKHKNRMDAMMGLHLEKSNQLISRIKAEEHLRKIESSPRGEERRSDGERRRSRDGHDKHSDSRSRRDRHRSSDQEFFPDIGDLVTLDTVGFEDENMDRELTETKSPEKTNSSEKSTDDSEKKEMESLTNKDGDLSVNQKGLSSKKSDSSSSENKRSSQADSKATKSDGGKLTKKEESSKEIDSKKKPATTPARKATEVEKKTPEGMEGITSKEGPSKGAASKTEDEKEKTNKSTEFRIPKLSSARKTVDGKEKGSGGMEFKIPKLSSTSPARKMAEVEQHPAEAKGDKTPVSDNLATKQKRDTSVQKVEDSTSTPSSSSVKEVKEVPQQTSGKTPSLQAKPDPPVTKEPASEIPPYSSDVPIGQNYIVPVTGFYCKLCSKFYNNEKAAKEAHCQTRAHYDKYKSAMIGLKTPVGGITKSAEKGEDHSAPSIDKKDESKSGVESPQTDPEGSTRGRAGSHANRGRRGRK